MTALANTPCFKGNCLSYSSPLSSSTSSAHFISKITSCNGAFFNLGYTTFAILVLVNNTAAKKMVNDSLDRFVCVTLKSGISSITHRDVCRQHTMNCLFPHKTTLSPCLLQDIDLHILGRILKLYRQAIINLQTPSPSHWHSPICPHAALPFGAHIHIGFRC